jgi:hypothetical protein
MSSLLTSLAIIHQFEAQFTNLFGLSLYFAELFSLQIRFIVSWPLRCSTVPGSLGKIGGKRCRLLLNKRGHLPPFRLMNPALYTLFRVIDDAVFAIFVLFIPVFWHNFFYRLCWWLRANNFSFSLLLNMVWSISWRKQTNEVSLFASAYSPIGLCQSIDAPY